MTTFATSSFGWRTYTTTQKFCRLILLSGFWVLSLLLPTSTIAGAGEACLLYPISTEIKFQKASLILEGKVISQNSFWDAGHQNIYTSSQVSIYKIFKGETHQKTVQIITEGGTVGLHRHVFSSTLSLSIGQQGVFYLQQENSLPLSAVLAFTVFGSLQGFIEYRLPERTAAAPFESYPDLASLYRQLQTRAGSPFKTIRENPDLENLAEQTTANRQQAPPVILSFSPEKITAGTNDLLTIRGLNFGNNRGSGFVEFRNANDGGAGFIKPLEADYVSWNNTEIVVKVPSSGTDEAPAGTGTFRVTNNDPASALSPAPLQVTFVYTNISNISQTFQPDHINSNKIGGYTFQFAANFNGNTAAKEGFIRSLNNWSCNTTINWLPAGATPVNDAVSDDINIVRFDVGNQLPTGVLGRCISRYRGCASGSTIVYFVQELDLEFDDDVRWQFGPAAPAANQFDFETVALHELGHGHQLGHIIAPGAVMHYAIGPGRLNRALNPISDIAGGNFVVDRSFTPNACGPAPMTPRAGTNCPLPQELVSFEAAYVPDSGVVLQWTTFKERNIVSFRIEHSADASNWSEIAAVPAGGTTTGTTSYRFTDTEPLPIICYYRLRIQKADGSFLFSQIIETVTQEAAFNMLEVLENPVRDVLRIWYTTFDFGTIDISIYDTAGRLHKRFKLEISPGANVTLLPVAELGLGMYIVHWNDQRQSKSIRIAKVTN